MTEIEQKALALVNEVLGEWGKDVRYSSLGRLGNSTSEALFRAIEAHEAFKQEVSDAVDAYLRINSFDNRERLVSLIIPAPKPDPLVDVAKSLGFNNTAAKNWAGGVRAALDDLGFEIRNKNDGQ